MRRLARSLLLTTALVPLSFPVMANPLDPNVVAGTATVAGEGTASVVVNQQSDKAIIDWRSFDIGVGEGTTFVQPGSQSVTLNRVIGGEGASQILGTLRANGQVFLINPDGILFGKDATVDVGGLVATTHDILNSDFLAGNYRFDQAGNAQASIVNLGTITVEDSGFAALVAPGVRNAGVIRANLGQIALASANQFTLDFYGDELLTLAVDDATAGSVVDLETGQTLQDLVSNSGLLSAYGGTVSLTASAARAVVNSVINNTGNIEADTVGTRNGKIILGAATANAKSSDAPVQSVKVSGTLSATGDDVGETGGTVEITGELIELTVATIDAFGWNGGGKVLVGGDYMGGEGDPTMVEEIDIPLEAHAIPTSAYVFADERTSINASAFQDGSGGKVILWSDIATILSAVIAARGGAESGDGGVIETSSKGVLKVTNPADASALSGAAGTWLLDPYSIRIATQADADFDVVVEEIYPGINGPSVYPNSTTSYIDVDTLEAALNVGNNVRIITRGTAGSGSGHIYVEDDIRKTAGGDVFLNLNAAGDVRFSSGVDVTSTSGKLAFHVYATDGKILGSNAGTIDVNGGQFLMAAGDGIDFHSSGPTPHLLTLDLSPVAPPSIPTVTIDVTFQNDKIYLLYSGKVARVFGDGVQLLGAANSDVEIYAHNLDVVLYDRALRVAGHRDMLSVYVDNGFNYGAYIGHYNNGLAEVIWEHAPPFTLLGEPDSRYAVPVLEISTDGGEGRDEYFATSLNGKALVRQLVAGSVSIPGVHLQGPAPTPLVLGVSTTVEQPGAPVQIPLASVSGISQSYYQIGLQAYASTARRVGVTIYNASLASTDVLEFVKVDGFVESYGSYSPERNLAIWSAVQDTKTNLGIIKLDAADVFLTTARLAEIASAMLEVGDLLGDVKGLFELLPQAASKISSLSALDAINLFNSLNKYALNPEYVASELASNLRKIGVNAAEITSVNSTSRAALKMYYAILSDMLVQEVIIKDKDLRNIFIYQQVINKSVSDDPSLVNDKLFLDQEVYTLGITGWLFPMKLGDAIEKGYYYLQ